MLYVIEGFQVKVCKLENERAALEGPAVIAMASGELVLRSSSAEDVVRLVNGDVAIAGPGVRVSCRAGVCGAEVLFFEADATWAAGVCRLAGCDDDAPRDAFLVHRAKSDDARRARKLVRELAAAETGSRDAADLRRLAIGIDLLSLVLDAARAPEVSAPDAGARRRDAFEAAVTRLEAGALDDVSLARFAAEMGLSERQASRRFRDVYGHTFREHFVRLRLARAKQLLRETERSVIDVANESGWRSLAHFNVVFRERVGVTPRDFRRGLGPALIGHLGAAR